MPIPLLQPSGWSAWKCRLKPSTAPPQAPASDLLERAVRGDALGVASLAYLQDGRQGMGGNSLGRGVGTSRGSYQTGVAMLISFLQHLV